MAWQFPAPSTGHALCGRTDFDKGCYLGQEIVARPSFVGGEGGIDQFAWQGKRPAAGDSWEDPEFGKGTVISTAGVEDSTRV